MGRGSSGSSKTGGMSFSTNEDAEDYFKMSNYDAWDGSLSLGERSGITEYTDVDSYEAINDALRTGKSLGAYDGTVKNIDKAISRFKLKDNINVYRGIGSNAIGAMFGTSDPTEINKKFKGGTITDKGYMSTSTNSSKAFKKTARLNITVKKGTGKGAYIAPLSQFKSESEFLLKRGTKLKIKNAYKDSSGTLVIDCEC